MKTAVKISPNIVHLCPNCGYQLGVPANEQHLPPIETHPFRLGYYKGHTWDKLSDMAINNQLTGPKHPDFVWTNLCLKNEYTGVSQATVFEHGVPQDTIWAVSYRVETFNNQKIEF